jgi:bifunctional UDP-N-acetylglucosamine pyrophosphorylase / glucosamine-1-phosphate N-acetyltransferase
MIQPRLAVLILAAGEGTRMKSALPKVLHQICGRSLLGHVTTVATTLGASTVALVLAQDTISPIREQFGDQYRYAVQAERRGTGHAVMQARDLLFGNADEVLVLFGDTPLLRPETAQKVVALRRSSQARLALLSFLPAEPTGYGRVLRDEAGHVVGLVEERDATAEQRLVRECNSGIMCIDAAWLWQALPQLQPSPLKNEYYLTDLVALAVQTFGAGAAVALTADDEREALGINDRMQLAEAEAIMRQRILADLMHAGVTIRDPHATYIDVDIRIGRDTIIYPGTSIQGATIIGEHCEIGPHSTIISSKIGDNVQLRQAWIEQQTIAANTIIEPFRLLKATE